MRLTTYLSRVFVASLVLLFFYSCIFSFFMMHKSSEPDDWQKGHLFHRGKGRVPLLTTPSLPSTAQQPLLPPSSPLPYLSPTPSIPSSFLTLRDSDAEMPVYPLGATREDRVSVIVLWRESITLTPETLENVLKGCPASTEVVYIHLDLVFWRPVLQQAEELQLRYPNLKIMTLSRWEDRQTTYRKGLERVNSRWVLFHDNNNLNLSNEPSRPPLLRPSSWPLSSALLQR